MEDMRECPTCQQQIPATADVCQHCDQEFCPDCYAPLPAMATQCDNCGAEFELLCPQCEEPIEAWMDECPACGFLLEDEGETEGPAVSDPIARALGAAGPSVTPVNRHDVAEQAEEEETRPCPNCDFGVQAADGFCRRCGQLFCGNCTGTIEEDDEMCPHCGVALYLDCPNCGFELSAGTEICPECSTLLPNFCVFCRQQIDAGIETCPHCGEEVIYEERRGARVAYSLPTEAGYVTIVSCPDCGEKFPMLSWECPSCDFRMCPRCQIDLLEEEEICPRCGNDKVTLMASMLGEEASADGDLLAIAAQISACPTCGEPVPAGADACPNCEQLLCPACTTAVTEDDLICPNCGVEFELLCPECEAVISATDESCPKCGVVFA